MPTHPRSLEESIDYIRAAADEWAMLGLTVRDIVAAFFESNPCDWRADCKIIKDWGPTHITPETRTFGAIVKYGDYYLRHSRGPLQGFSWDTYPDDMQTMAYAFKALTQAPPPYWLWFEASRNIRDPGTSSRAQLNQIEEWLEYQEPCNGTVLERLKQRVIDTGNLAHKSG